MLNIEIIRLEAKERMNKKLSIRDLCQIGIFTAVIIICAQISVPMPYGVPMTMQTFAIPLAGIVLGAKKGTISSLVYILLGMAGIPVFSGFSCGIGTVFGMTGGFIISFPIMALFAGIGEGRRKMSWLISGLIAGTAVNFFCGMVYFSLVMSNSLHTSFTACVLPFIPAGVIKIILAAVSGRTIKRVLVRGGMLD